MDIRINIKPMGKEIIEYKIISGNEKIVFIKAGAGGNTSGNDNKYVKMANSLHERLGATVICASNPNIPHESVDEEKIRQVVAENNFSEFELYFVGTSDGAYQNLSLAKRFVETKKILSINSSFSTFSRLEERICALPSVEKIFVLGTDDDDYDELIAIKNIACDNLKLIEVDGADHRFTGKLDEFIKLVDIL